MLNPKSAQMLALNCFLFFSLALPVVAQRTATRPETVGQIVEKLVSGNQLGGGTIGIYVMDAKSEEVLADVNGNLSMKPASNNKLLTTAAGLSLLGPEHIFITELLHMGEIENGVLKGDLIIRGGGDPTISGRFQKDKKDVTAIMRRWATELKQKGIVQIRGDIVADDTYFDRDYFHDSWYPGERAEWYEAEISALAFNDNCIDLTWSAQNKLPGDLASVLINPKTKYATLDNQVKVVAKGRPTRRDYKRPEIQNQITALGTVEVDTRREDSSAIHNGPLYFATVFRDVLTQAEMEISGSVRLSEEREGRTAAEDASTLLRHSSPPLAEVLKVINLNSQNFYAECLLKTLGREKAGKGSFEDGAKIVMEFFRRSGVYSKGNVVVDGSGLSAKNMVTPRQLVEVLRFMDQSPYRGEWRESLPIGGVRGSLKKRFQSTARSRQLAPQVMGKTGLIGGVRALSGVVKNREGEEFYYSILLNGFSSKADPIGFIDSVVLALADSQ